MKVRVQVEFNVNLSKKNIVSISPWKFVWVSKLPRADGGDVLLTQVRNS